MASSGSGTTVNWDNLTNVPPGFADGVDDTTGGGLSGSGATSRLSQFTGPGTLGESQIIATGAGIGIGTDPSNTRLDVRADFALRDYYGPWQDYEAYYNPCLHCADTCDNNDWNEFTCPDGVSATCEDARDSDGEHWQYRLVECDQRQKAARFVGNVKVENGAISGDGSGLTNVSASALSINCPVNTYLIRTTTGWVCRVLPQVCQDGDWVNCYEGDPSTKDVGACQGGTRTCGSGMYGVTATRCFPLRKIAVLSMMLTATATRTTMPLPALRAVAHTTVMQTMTSGEARMSPSVPVTSLRATRISVMIAMTAMRR